MNIDTYKQNHKTAYLAAEYERLSKEEADLRALAESDVSMRELAEGDLATLLAQKEALLAQMKEIVESEKEEETFPNEIVLEVRGGAGGEEAALFAEELANMYQRHAEKKGWNVRGAD